MVAMPAQGQKSWDEVSCCDFLAASVVAMSAQGQKSWDMELPEGSIIRHNACPGAEILGHEAEERVAKGERRRNACPGAEILGHSSRDRRKT